MIPVKENLIIHHRHIVSVAVALPVHDAFSYSVPAHLAPLACPGKRVLVPFGRRRVTGYLVGPAGEPTDKIDPMEIKHILDVLDDTPLFPETMIPFFKWIAAYYMHPLGQVIHTALPAGLNLTDIAILTIGEAGVAAAASPHPSPLEKIVLSALAKGPAGIKQLQKVIDQPVSWALIHQMRQRGWIQVDRQIKARQIRPKTVRWVTVKEATPASDRLSVQRKIIRNALETEGDLSVPELKTRVPTAAALVRAMQKAGQVAVYEKTVYRDPFGDPIEPDIPPRLTEEQAEAVSVMAPLLGQGFKTVLLAGITGSGKTEVYLRLTQAALDKGLGVLVLVPEIALISQTERRFRARFGETVAVLHSGLSQGERYDQWLRIAKADATIAIGARSCIFAPFGDVGLIIVDEEHDASYKQEGGLSYNARDLAVVRARHHNALAILGSATPSVQSWYNVSVGKYETASLTRRVNRQPLPAIQTVDLAHSRDDRGIRRYITAPLQQEIQKTLDDGKQALIFLNRRGFAAFPICGQCGQPLRCKNCDISLTLHKRANAFRCHYCGFSKAAVSTCPSCGSEKIRLLGVGTEKIQEAMTQLFPEARVARMDRDTMTRKGSVVNLLKDLKHRRIDILVGTQMVAKGHDFPDITLVGVVCADLTLNFPDFRAGERTFQLLAQVAGRAGRGDQPGRVILQTYNPNHFSILAAKDQDFKAFYNQEIGFRKALGYPPFSRMIAVRISSKDSKQAAAHARALGENCRKLLAADGPYYGRIQVMGPLEAPLSRIAKHHRWQILIKSPHTAMLHRFAYELILDHRAAPAGRQIKVTVDVDPFFLM
ncbi:primosomal protein N' [Desulfosarcina sp.]|uniref:replication restart helicase PriA n=1 Tax=Desulfosarcina sp. TaxID=2027861 RepID=UPI0029AD19CC|nr:primosomal protein N' [Desulfosarcina sp.]MDX2453812.1 primosomal protein N' [Desulfosarcina sp.]MDX2491512.1 primosomal protein N' [Desulfosarcina sp.]